MDCYSSLMDQSVKRLRNAWLLKLKAMKLCSEQELEHLENLKHSNEAGTSVYVSKISAILSNSK